MKTRLILAAATLAFASFSVAQSKNGYTRGEMIGKPVVGTQKAITLTTAQIQARTKIGPIKYREPKRTEVEVDRDHLQNFPGSPNVSSWPVSSSSELGLQSVPDGDGKGSRGPLFSLGTTFGGPTLGESGSVPPDSTGDVSPSSVIIAANGRIRSYDRTGAAGSLNSTDDTFFSTVSGGGGLSDPRVIFDRITQRWFVCMITTNLVLSNNRIMLAVSNGEAITASTVWSYYSFNQNVGGGTNGFCDYPTLAVDANGVYIGSNKFNTSLTAFVGCDLFVVRKSSVTSGGPIVVTPFRNLCVSGGAGIYTPWGCTNDDPTAATGLVLGVDNAAFGLLKARRVNTPGGTPTLSAEISVTVPSTTIAADMPISTSSTTTGSVDTLDDRLFYARIFLNRATGERTVWSAHNIGVGTSGTASAGGRSAARWYQLNNLFTGTLGLVQSGTVFDNAFTNPIFHSIPSVAMNGQGHAFAGFTRGNAANSPGVGGAYRLNGAALGTMNAPTTLVAGANYYAVQGTGVTGQRWGDYSVTTVDPRDGMSIWSFQEYVNANNSWRVQAVKMLAPAPTVTGIAPSSVTQGDTGINLVITGTGIFDPDPSYPDHLAVAIPSGFTINSVTWNSATQATVNVSVSGSAATGSRTVTLTNPDGQTATRTINVLTAVRPVSGNLTLQGYVGSVTSLQFLLEIRDASTNAVLQTQNLTGLGSGNSFSFNTSLATGTYKLRIKGNTRFLAKSQTITIGSGGATGLAYTLLNGDVDGSNGVGAVDFNQLRAAWGTSTTGGADLNGDGIVGGLDFNIMRNSWGLFGDN
jgi:hypothetical protein